MLVWLRGASVHDEVVVVLCHCFHITLIMLGFRLRKECVCLLLSTIIVILHYGVCITAAILYPEHGCYISFYFFIITIIITIASTIPRTWLSFYDLYSL